MNFELKLALKYFRSKKKSLARFTSIVAVIGITVGVASLIISQSLANGFQDEMRDKILANTAHISVFRADGTEINDGQALKTNLEQIENIRGISLTTLENAILISETETSYAVLKVRSRESGVESQKQISIGIRLAEKLNLKIGDAAEIATLENQTPSRVRVAETFETGLYDYDSAWIYVSPEYFAYLNEQKFFTPKNLQISVTDIYKAGETAEKIRENLGENFKVVDWQEANRPLFAALSLEKKASLAVILLIVFIAVMNITTTLALLVNERKLDIAILRTCGAKTRSLLTIFLIEGLFLGLSGILFGLILGLLGCFAGNYFKIISLSAEVYALNYIPLRPNFADILLIVAVAFALCLLATIYPAFRASQIKPLENLRNQ
jgi:lipoprotein-releasing system permease protein